MTDSLGNAVKEHPVDISFLFIHYARSDLLQLAVESLREAIQTTDLCCEFIISALQRN